MDDHIIRKYADTVGNQRYILFQSKRFKKPGFVVGCKIRSPEHMEKLEFDAVRSAVADISDGFQHIITGLTREPEDHVDYNIYADRFQPFYSVIIYLQIVSAAYVSGSLFMDRLESEFHPDRFCAVHSGNKIYDFLRQTVRSCCNGQCDYVRMRQRFFIKSPQMIYRPVGVGECLKICNIFFIDAGKLVLDRSLSGFNLI